MKHSLLLLALAALLLPALTCTAAAATPPASAATAQAEMETREFDIYPGFFPKDKTVRETLEARGITFPEGAQAAYHRTPGVLVLHNTEKNLKAARKLASTYRKHVFKQVDSGKLISTAPGKKTCKEARLLAEALEKCPISRLHYEDLPMEEALRDIEAQAQKAGAAIRIIYEDAPPSEKAGSGNISSLRIENLTAKEALDLTCAQGGCRYRIESDAVYVAPAGKLYERRWLAWLDTFIDGDDGLTSMEDAFKNCGVPAREGSSLTYDPKTRLLTARNQLEHLDHVDECLLQYAKHVKEEQDKGGKKRHKGRQRRGKR